MAVASGYRFKLVVPPEAGFRVFQTLPPLLRSALLYVVDNRLHSDRQRAGSNWIITLYPMEETQPIGEFIGLWESATQGRNWTLLESMARAYIDNGHSMVAAKLAWSEDY